MSTIIETIRGQENDELCDKALPHILSFLDPLDLQNCRLVCRSWCQKVSHENVFFGPVNFYESEDLREFIERQFTSSGIYENPFTAYRFYIESIGRESIDNFKSIYESRVRKCEIISEYEMIEDDRDSLRKVFDLIKLSHLSSLSFKGGESSSYFLYEEPEGLQEINTDENKEFKSTLLKTLKFKNRAFHTNDIFLPRYLIDKFPAIQKLTLTLSYTFFYDGGFESLLPELVKIPVLDLRLDLFDGDYATEIGEETEQLSIENDETNVVDGENEMEEDFEEDSEEQTHEEEDQIKKFYTEIINDKKNEIQLTGEIFEKLAKSGLALKKLKINFHSYIREDDAERLQNQATILNAFSEFLMTQAQSLQSLTFTTHGKIHTNFTLPNMTRLKKLKFDYEDEPDVNLNGTPFYGTFGEFPTLDKLDLYSKSYKMFATDKNTQILTLRDLTLDFLSIEPTENIKWGNIFPNVKILKILGPISSKEDVNHLANDIFPQITHLNLASFDPTWELLCGDTQNSPKEKSEDEILELLAKKERGENISWERKEDSTLKSLFKLDIGRIKDVKTLNILVYLSAIEWIRPLRLTIKSDYAIEEGSHPAGFINFLKNYHQSFFYSGQDD